MAQDKLGVVIVGKGGEGVALAADILGLAATMDGKFSSSRSTYGASQRGESVFSEVVISNKPVIYPFVEEPEFIIVLSRLGFEAYFDTQVTGKIKLADETRLFFDTTTRLDVTELTYNVKTIQIDIGTDVVNRNTILLGCFTRSSKAISKSSMENAIKQNVSKKYLKQNLKAFNFGYNSVP